MRSPTAAAYLRLVRPVNSRTVIAILALLLAAVPASAEKSTRMLMYTFQDGPVLIHVGMIDTPRAPRGFVAAPTAPRRQKAFTVSPQQFERAWQALQASGAEKFASPQSANRKFDATKNYVFSIAHMPDGAKTNFVVPKSRASATLISLARQFEGHAR